MPIIWQLRRSNSQLFADRFYFSLSLSLSPSSSSGADINAMCSAAGLIALRERRRMITHVDFEEAKRQVLYKKASNLPASLYC